MIYENLLKTMIENKNEENIGPMEAYMKNQFEFLGIKSVKRRDLSRPFIKELKREKGINWDFINKCWLCEYREMQYIAQDYLRDRHKYLQADDLSKVRLLIENKSWWDTVDSLSKVIGDLVLLEDDFKGDMLVWSKDENLWVRRSSILHQLKLKEETDEKLLKEIILNNLGTDEFFINKAIGWILREYSKTNPAWVEGFLEDKKEELNSLSIREASKYIKR